MNANFTYEVIGKVIVVYDLDQGGKSVTNDAENVIQSIVQDIGTIKGYRVIYRDTLKMFDEMIVSDNSFEKFSPIRESKLDLALASINATRLQ